MLALWSDDLGDSLTFRQVLRFPQAPSSIELGAPESINGKMVVPVAYETERLWLRRMP